MMKEKLGTPVKRPLADFLPTLTIAAKNLATEMTNDNVQQLNLQGEAHITDEHVNNNLSVRGMLDQRGIRPERLPAEEDIKKLERRVKSDEKKLVQRSGKLPRSENDCTDTSKLKKFAQHARRQLREQVGARMELVLDAGSAARRENLQAVKELEKQLKASSRERTVERVAYTWFNRFCALRFMDLNGYTRIRVVSPADEGQFQPEILAEAKAGHIDTDRVFRSHPAPRTGPARGTGYQPRSAARGLPSAGGSRVQQLPSGDALSVRAHCRLHRAFDAGRSARQRDLGLHPRSDDSGPARRDVEVIGWLYQFYISEKKDQVFDGLKKNQRSPRKTSPPRPSCSLHTGSCAIWSTTRWADCGCSTILARN